MYRVKDDGFILNALYKYNIYIYIYIRIQEKNCEYYRLLLVI